MARYYFNYRRAGEITPDDIGISFSSFEEAYLAAFEGARDLWLELLRERRDPRQSSFEVCDEKGRLLFVLPFAEILQSCNAEGPPRRDSVPFAKVQESALRARRSFSDMQAELGKARTALQESRALLSRVEALIQFERNASF